MEYKPKKINKMEDALITAIVFTGIYQLIKVFTDFLLKRKIIKAGHMDKAGILDPLKDKEENSYPTLKWGLVTLFAGVGLLVISLIDKGQHDVWMRGSHSYMPVGIELIAISLGFLSYFLISRISLNK
ncbi:MAG: hypothetical protein ACFFG0_18775 [Candidatus Thorarchaeota archaeon]